MLDFDKLLLLMVQKNGSDLFITADVPPSMKVNGTIMPVTKSPLNAEQSMALVKSIIHLPKSKNLKKPTSANLPSPTKTKPRVFVCRRLCNVTWRAWCYVKLKPKFPPLSSYLYHLF